MNGCSSYRVAKIPAACHPDLACLIPPQRQKQLHCYSHRLYRVCCWTATIAIGTAAAAAAAVVTSQLWQLHGEKFNQPFQRLERVRRRKPKQLVLEQTHQRVGHNVRALVVLAWSSRCGEWWRRRAPP